jgi:hypothetical protein
MRELERILRAKASPAEFKWRKWYLGLEEYKADGPGRLSVRPKDAPAKIPLEWWIRFDAWMQRRAGKRVETSPGLIVKLKAQLATPKPAPVAVGQLSRHFHVSQFHCRDGTRVPESAIPGLKRLCDVVLEPLYVRYGGGRVNSGYRTRRYNSAIGGATNSFHTYELRPAYPAADLTFYRGRPADWAATARSCMPRGVGGVGRYDRSNFVHVDMRPYVSSWSL